VAVAVSGAFWCISAGVAAARPFIDPFHTVTRITSTVPANGDVNPYGIVIVPRSVGELTQGDILISNFNNSANLQGTGTTIVESTPGGQLKLFASISAGDLPGRCPGGVGLTTALVALRSGFVIVGSLPTENGMSATAKAGCLLVLNSQGQVVETIAGGPINGPWDMTAVDRRTVATLFVTNVLNGTVAANGATEHDGTVVRIRLRIPDGSIPVPTSIQEIARGFATRTDPTALVVGPTGVAFSTTNRNTLYVADTVNSRIATIPDVMNRTTVFQGAGNTVSSGGALNGPLGLTAAPGGDLIAANGGDGNVVELTPSGMQVKVRLVTPAGAGSLFGLTTVRDTGVYFVDDFDNVLRLLH
jgi:hypothetical protein